MEELSFPKFDYHLDESDPDVVILRRQDGSFVAAFSARGATKEGILASLPRAAKLSRQALPSGLPQLLLVASLDNEIEFRQSSHI